MITFDHVTKKYRTNIGLDDVSVHINKGDFVFLVGPSGAGKSTFIKLILKEINADEGTIKVGDFGFCHGGSPQDAKADKKTGAADIKPCGNQRQSPQVSRRAFGRRAAEGGHSQGNSKQSCCSYCR